MALREIEAWTELLDEARESGTLVGEAFEYARAARTAEIPDEVHPLLRDALVAGGIERLYEHQAAALEAAWAGPTIVTTGTASGKSLCFNLPALDVLLRDCKLAGLVVTAKRPPEPPDARMVTGA